MSKIASVEWKKGFPTNGVKVEAAHKALEKIRKDNDAKLDPAVVVSTVAKAKRNVLRAFFQWDDTEAAGAYRVDQARSLLRAVHIVYEDAPEVKTRAYEITVERQEAKPVTIYKTAEDILADPDSRAELLKRALGELVSFQRRFRALQELAVVFRSIDETLTSLKV